MLRFLFLLLAFFTDYRIVSEIAHRALTVGLAAVSILCGIRDLPIESSSNQTEKLVRVLLGRCGKASARAVNSVGAPEQQKPIAHSLPIRLYWAKTFRPIPPLFNEA